MKIYLGITGFVTVSVMLFFHVGEATYSFQVKCLKWTMNARNLRNMENFFNGTEYDSFYVTVPSENGHSMYYLQRYWPCPRVENQPCRGVWQKVRGRHLSCLICSDWCYFNGMFYLQGEEIINLDGEEKCECKLGQEVDCTDPAKLHYDTIQKTEHLCN